MSAFGGLILTNRGRNLQAKAQTGTTLNFTRVAIGDGQLEGSSILDLTALKNEKVSLAINKLKVLTGGQAVVGAVFSNQGLVSGFYWRELGLFAQDPDLGEILYCYGNAGANAEYIPADGGPDIVEKNIDVVSIVGNASSVTATIDQSLIFATQQDVDDTINSHLTDYVRQPGYGVTAGSANIYAVTLSPAPATYTAGMGITVKINVANTGASTLNINGLGAKPILDSKGNAMSPGKLRLNGVYTLRYDGTNFILQGEGASGNAAASDLLSGRTATTDAGEITGTMPNRGAINITPSSVAQSIAEGYHSGGGSVAGSANLVAANIKSGVNIFGVNGSVIEATGNAADGEVLSGRTFSRAGAAGRTGTMANKGAKTFTPSASIQSDTAGYYSSVTCNAVSVPAANVLAGTTIAGVSGTMPNRSGAETGVNFNHTVAGMVKLSPAAGYYDGATGTRVLMDAADLQAANILTGKNILGIAGTAKEAKSAVVTLSDVHTYTTYTDHNVPFTINTLNFTPNQVFLFFEVKSWPSGGSESNAVLYGEGNTAYGVLHQPGTLAALQASGVSYGGAWFVNGALTFNSTGCTGTLRVNTWTSGRTVKITLKRAIFLAV